MAATKLAAIGMFTMFYRYREREADEGGPNDASNTSVANDFFVWLFIWQNNLLLLGKYNSVSKPAYPSIPQDTVLRAVVYWGVLISPDHLGDVCNTILSLWASGQPRQTHWQAENSPKTFIVQLISLTHNVSTLLFRGSHGTLSDTCTYPFQIRLPTAY